ncbi:MAG: DUF5906 domain-containing protein [Campylobacterales bacterium]
MILSSQHPEVIEENGRAGKLVMMHDNRVPVYLFDKKKSPSDEMTQAYVTKPWHSLFATELEEARRIAGIEPAIQDDILPQKDKISINLEKINEKLSDQSIGEQAPQPPVEGVDFSNFIENNWKRDDVENDLIDELDAMGAGVWLNASGDVCYRFDKDGEVFTVPSQKAANVFGSLVGRQIKLFTADGDLRPNDLKIVTREIFEPTIPMEFMADGARNLFKPTQYMRANGKPKREPKAIIALIRHLCTNDSERTHWTLNWLASFFVTMKRSTVSLYLRGAQGTGKGIFFDLIIRPLFGVSQTIQINDRIIQSHFSGAAFENKIFVNIDEGVHDARTSKASKNFLKGIITNEMFTIEKKFENIKGESRLTAQLLFTTNEPIGLEIEPSDRRFTIFQTGEPLKQCNFLGYGSYNALAAAIKSELNDFALYLKNFQIDVNLANTALDTEEKAAMVEVTNDKFELFVNALKKKDIEFFSSLPLNLKTTLLNDFEKNRFCKESVREIFEALFDEEVSSKFLFSRLRVVDPILFSSSNIAKSNGFNYFKILQ